MPERYVNMTEDEYREVIAEWHRVNRAFRGTEHVNTANRKKESPPDPNRWREKQDNLKFRER